jgi:hypothetical protein
VIVWLRQVHQKPFYNNTDSCGLGQIFFLIWGKDRKSTTEVKNLIGSNKMTSSNYMIQEKEEAMIVNRLNYKIKSDYGDLHKKNACRKKMKLNSNTTQC